VSRTKVCPTLKSQGLQQTMCLEPFSGFGVRHPKRLGICLFVRNKILHITIFFSIFSQPRDQIFKTGLATTITAAATFLQVGALCLPAAGVFIVVRYHTSHRAVPHTT
jgi:hypothetical protein